MIAWLICVFRRHQWYSRHDSEIHRTRTICGRCGTEKTSFAVDMDRFRV